MLRFKSHWISHINKKVVKVKWSALYILSFIVNEYESISILFIKDDITNIQVAGLILIIRFTKYIKNYIWENVYFLLKACYHSSLKYFFEVRFSLFQNSSVLRLNVLKFILKFFTFFTVYLELENYNI